jgi:hypothetical protein
LGEHGGADIQRLIVGRSRPAHWKRQRHFQQDFGQRDERRSVRETMPG